MTKAFAFAALLASACATATGEISGGPEHGTDDGVATAPRVTGTVTGVTAGRVVLGNDRWLAAREIIDGGFAFEGVPDGTYFAKLEVAGFLSPVATVIVTRGFARVTLTATPMVGGFGYRWERDASRGGREQGTRIGSARTLLREAYSIELSDEDQVWSDEHAARLLHTMRTVPQAASAAYAPVALESTTWVLSSGDFTRDGDVVRVPQAAFASGRFIANALHGEIVSYVTNEGRDRTSVERILGERYGVRAWLFGDAESVALISMLEDMPGGLHTMPALKTIIRRTGGAPVRSSVPTGSLEIADSAFAMERREAQHGLVREKARFVVTPELQAAWGEGDVAEAIADYVVRPDLMTEQGTAVIRGLALETPQPIGSVAIGAIQRRVTVELGLTVEGISSATIFLFDSAGHYTMLALDPVPGTRGTVVRGARTLARVGSWRPDVIVVSDRHGVATVQDISEVGWQLEVE